MSDINDRIAIAEGWEWRPKAQMYVSPNGSLYADAVPDFTGTLEGVAGMMRELRHWHLSWVTLDATWHMLPVWRERVARHGAGAWVCKRYRDGIGVADDFFASAFERPGDCVGEARLSVFGKEAGNDL